MSSIQYKLFVQLCKQANIAKSAAVDNKKFLNTKYPLKVI